MLKKTGLWSTILEYFFGGPVPQREPLRSKSLYFFLPGYFKVQKRRIPAQVNHETGKAVVPEPEASGVGMSGVVWDSGVWGF